MARQGALVRCSIWQDEDFIALPSSVQWLYLFLLSQPDLNHLGTLPLLPTRWAQAAPGLDVEQVMSRLETLEAARFVVTDPINGVVLIRTFLRNDRVLAMPNVLRSAAATLKTLASPKIAEAIHQEMVLIDETELLDSVQPIFSTMKEQAKAVAAKGFRNPSPNPSENPSPKGSANPPRKGSENPSGNPLGVGVGVKVSGEGAVRARARGSRLPDPFPVTAEMVAWARERTPGVDGRRETEKFINYWRAKTGADATKLDWLATWRNWMLRAAERLPQPRGPVSSGSTTDDRVAQALELGAQLQARMDRGEIEA